MHLYGYDYECWISWLLLFHKLIVMLCLSRSWVQTQLKNHPDEIWEDGVRDYLDHATGIMVILHMVTLMH